MVRLNELSCQLIWERILERYEVQEETRTRNLLPTGSLRRDEEYRLEKISQANDPLEKLKRRIKWEIFRPLLEEHLAKGDRGQWGCRPYDYVMMFKILILQRYYNLADDKMEFAILDRLSFMRFLGLTMSDRVPDAKTIWNFREQLTRNGVIEKLFTLFREELEEEGLIGNKGKMIDATFIEVPIQRNTREENKSAGSRPSSGQIKGR